MQRFCVACNYDGIVSLDRLPNGVMGTGGGVEEGRKREENYENMLTLSRHIQYLTILSGQGGWPAV